MTPSVTLQRPSLAELTDKQLSVLEHLAQHKTSKEIARDLNVAQNTVDKHLTAVRRKWGTSDRFHTVRVFEELRRGGENHPPQFSAGDGEGDMPPMPGPDLPDTAVFQLSDILRIEDFAEWATPAPKGLQALDQRFGKVWRIAAIPLFALTMGMMLIAILACARTLSDLM